VVGINTGDLCAHRVFAGIGLRCRSSGQSDLEELIDTGHVTRGWLGVELGREITPAMVKAFGLSDTKGALVNEVLKNSPGRQGGAQAGHVIRSYDGKAWIIG